LKSWQSALNAPLPLIRMWASGYGDAVVPQSELDLDASGLLGTYQPGGATDISTNAFFQSLGTNGRSCATCHQPASAMSISLDAIKLRFALTGGADPLFAPVDAAVCPSAVPAAATSPSHGGRLMGHGSNMAQAYSLLLTRGVFRIFLPVPANAEYTLTVVSDPTTCNLDPNYNQVLDASTGAVTQIVSVYRRPRPTTNAKFVTTTDVDTGLLPAVDSVTKQPLAIDPNTGLAESGNIMWDGREPSLQSQAVDATLGHAQALSPPTPAQVDQIVAFELGVYSAQSYGTVAGSLTAFGATGGPLSVEATLPGQAASLGHGPRLIPFDAWSTISGKALGAAQRESIYRGEEIFNTRQFSVSNVAGFNNVTTIGNQATTTCSGCHNQVNVGNSAFADAQRDIGTTHVASPLNAATPATDLPIFQLTCNGGASTAFAGTTVTTNDPGLALITGKCADIGRVSVPQLRGLVARSPYFHDGSAATLADVVNFYNHRFGIGLSAQDESDLTNFLSSL
jgi:cytochrome c peroxidase